MTAPAPSLPYSFVAEPDAPLFESREDDAEFDALPVGDVEAPTTPLGEALRDAYAVRIDAYYRDLRQALGSQPAQDGELPVSAFPSLTRSSDASETIVFDATLFATLLDIYIFEGWGALVRIEDDVKAKAHPEGRPDEQSAGTPALPWIRALGLFIYCRNMLAVLVASELVDIERAAAATIVARLSVTATRVATAWKKEFGITRTLVPSSGDVFDVPLTDRAVYTFSQKALMATLTKAVGEAVTARAKYEQVLERITHLRHALQIQNRNIRRNQQPGRKPPSQQAIAERDRTIARLSDQMALRSASANFFSSLRAIVAMNCPLGLLVIDGLKPTFTQATLEDALGTALWAVYERIDTLGAGIDPDQSRVRQILADLTKYPAGRGITAPIVQSLDVPAGGPEGAVAEAAIARLPKDSGMLALLHAPTWHLLQSDYAPGTMGHLVMHRYLETLDDRMAGIAEHQQAVEEFFRAFNRGASALSIALLVTPLGEFAPALRTASVVGDLALAAYQISSVTAQLSELDDAVSARLLQPEAYATANLAKLGELMIARRDIAIAVTEQVVLELIGVIAAGRWNVVRRLLITRGFLLDVRTVFDDAHG